MRPLMLVALAGLLVACTARSPSLPPVPEDQRAASQTAEDWEDWGPDASPREPQQTIEGTRLNTDQINAVFSGRVLRGCYPNGATFAEVLDDDGRFYDANNDRAFLGLWAARSATLCFDYPDQGESCFAVIQVDNRYDFYTTDLQGPVASTGCQ